ncbi:MAG: FAD-dependent oxidoreductase, partial [Gammaproteobacteria bacterium]|nr:FAD-dependent oxidoreductase [Gammaproteobacteria bacterium]
VRDRATGVDLAGQRVLLAGGDPLGYDRLLIACGSRPRPAPWEGSDLEGIGSFVTLQDCEWLERELHGGSSHPGGPPRPDAHLQASDPSSAYWRRPSVREARGGPPRAAAVIGGGLIGIEAVEVLTQAKVPVRFFIREDWFWPMALDEREATWIANRMRDHGVEMRLGEEVERFEGAGRVERLVRKDGEKEDTDLALVAIGVVPNTEWLKGSDLELQDESRGIVVDRHLRTSDPNVFAAGDCAAVEWLDGSRRPEQLWYTARDQGRVAGRGLLGDGVAEYHRGHWYNSAKLMDIEYTTAGLVNMNVEDERNFFHEERGKVRSTTRIVLSGDRVVGFNMLGRRWDHSVLIRFIEEHRSLDYVLGHLNEAAFDTEFVPPLQLPMKAETLDGPAPS